MNGKKKTPYSLVYGSEEVPPLEFIILTNRTANLDMDSNDDNIRTNVDVSMERREVAAIQQEHYKKKMESYYNQRVKDRCFKVGQQVLRNNESSRQEPNGKLRPTYEGPYIINEANRDGSYILQTMKGEMIS